MIDFCMYHPKNMCWQIFVSDNVFFPFWKIAILSPCWKSTISSGCDIQTFFHCRWDFACSTQMTGHMKHKVAKIDNIKLIFPLQKWHYFLTVFINTLYISEITSLKIFSVQKLLDLSCLCLSLTVSQGEYIFFQRLLNEDRNKCKEMKRYI